MRTDFLNSEFIDRSRPGSVQHKMIRGRVSSLMLMNSATWHYKDKITVKLRHAGGMLTIVDRVPALLLADRCDLMKGRPSIGTMNYAGDELNGVATGENDEAGGLVQLSPGQASNIDAFELPLGHITLSGDSELEITVETAVQHTAMNSSTVVAPNTVKGLVQILAISRQARTDTILTWDVVSNLEDSHGGVREIYLVGKNHCSLLRSSSFAGQVEGMDITVRLNVDGEDSECNIDALAALTTIEGQLSTAANALIRLYQDLESLPATCYVKVFGVDKDKVELLLLRETQVPHMVAASILTGINNEQKRIEKLEQNEPDKARALQQTGKIASSEALQVAKENLVAAVPVPVK